MSTPLHTHRYGPAGPLQVLAIHGLTGHGRRWQAFAEAHLAGVAVAAPDLLGHGRSSWSAPWTIEANVDALAALLDAEADAAAVVVGHSFGGAVALALAAARPDLVSALVLLDPALHLDGDRMRVIAEAMIADPDFGDRDQARADKLAGSWGEVDEELLEAELDEHLVRWPSGRWGWRMCLPAVVSYWSELARPVAVPARPTPTVLVRAGRVRPPYVTDATVATLRAALGDELTVTEFDCDHMVAQARPADTARLVQRLVAR